MKTVLMLPFGIGLAHTGRLIMIARSLRRMGIKAIFGAGSDAVNLIKRENFDLIEIPEFPKKTYEKKLKNNNFFVYNRKIIEEFVSAELDLYTQVKPDLVVYDGRFTAGISSEIAGLKTISVTNANLTPYYDYSQVKFPMDTILVKFLPDKVLSFLDKKYGQEFLKRIGPLLMQAVLFIEMIKLSPSLVKLGYRLSKDPYQLFMGDVTLLPDIPEYRPVTDLPDNIKMVGPISWDGGRSIPEKVRKIGTKDNIVYVTAAGTGDKKTFINIIRYLKDTDYTVIATTGNTLKPLDVNIDYKNLYKADFLPGDFILPKSKLIIFPGGNSTCYHALSFGVPQILTPFHIDQEDNANQLERLGTGIMINPYKDLNKKNLVNAVDEIMHNNLYKKRSLKFKKILRDYNGPATAARAISKFIG